MSFQFTPEFLQQAALMADAEARLQRISDEDNAIIDAYMQADMDGSTAYFTETQPPDELPEEESRNRFQKSSDLYRLIYWFAHQHDVPGGINALIRGMATVTEDKWSQAQAFRAWITLRTTHAKFLDANEEYLKARGIDWRKIPAPKLDKIKSTPSGKQPIKEVLLDTRSMGFIIHFRYLQREEHDKVRGRVSRIPGRQYFDGRKPGQRMPGEPHWYIPGDSISARALRDYLLESNQKIQELADQRNYANASYWARRLEAIPWNIKDGAIDRMNWLIDRSKRMLAMSEAHAPSVDFKLHYEYKNAKNETPRQFQVAGVEYILECTQESRYSNGLHGTGVYVGDPMGLGKSLECGIMAVIEAWEEQLERNPGLKREDLRCLILCPASLKKNWFREFMQWLGQQATNLNFQYQIIRGNKAVPIWGNFVIVNPELLRKEYSKQAGQWEPLPLYTMLLATRWFAIVGDEFHYYKSWGAQRSANTLELFSGKKYDSKKMMFAPFRLPVPLRIGMSGSPVLNRPAEWPCQLEALGLLEPLGGQHRYVATYCGKNTPPELLKELSVKLKERGYLRREKVDMVEDPAGRVVPIANVPKEILDTIWVPREQWEEILAKHGYRFLSGVLGQLPPKIRTVITLPLSREWRTEYMRAERDFINWLAEHYRDYDDADRRIAAAMRAQALVYIQKLKHLAAKAKLGPAIKWVKNFMEEDETQKLVYYCYHLDIHAALVKAFPGCAQIVGGQDPDVRQANVDQFQNDPNCRLIVCTIGSGGVGITLTAANHMAILELPWGPAIVDQMEDRIWGRLNDVHGASIYLHLADYTIDTRIAAMIDRKREIVTAVTSGSDVEEQAFIHELLDDYFEMYGREDPKSFEEIVKMTTNEEDEEDSDPETSGK